MTLEKAELLIIDLAARGFDKCRIDDQDEDSDVDLNDRTYAVHVGCSQCEALCINGVATHESRCPRDRAGDDDCDADGDEPDDREDW